MNPFMRWRLATPLILLFFALSCGVALVRRNL